MNNFLIALAVLTWGWILKLVVDRRQRGLAVGLSWLFPGLGQIYLGHRARGLCLGGIVLAVFIAGCLMCDFRNIAPFAAHGAPSGRHSVWALAQFFTGLPMIVTAAVTHGLYIERSMSYYSVGCLYSAIAGLLNLLLMVDAYDLATPDDAPNQPSAAAPTTATKEPTP